MWLGLRVQQQSKGYGEDGPNSNSSGRKEDIICGGDASVFKERGQWAGRRQGDISLFNEYEGSTDGELVRQS